MDLSIFNPAKPTAEAKEAVANLSREQIAELAKMYPNSPRGMAYLFLFDTSLPEDKQHYPLSTFQNLANLHKLGKHNYRVHSYRKGAQTTVSGVVTKAALRKKGTKVVDLSAKEAAELPGIKKHVEQALAEAGAELAQVPGPEAANEAPVQTEVLTEAQAALQKAIEEKAHPSTIKKLEKAVNEEAIAKKA